MAEKAQINFQVNEDQRKRWKQAAEEDMSHNSLSQFIRTAVEEKIAGDNSQQRPQTGPEMGKILERLDSLDDIHQTLDHIHSRLRNVEQEVKHDPAIDYLTTELFDYLPDVQPGTRKWEEEMEDRQHQLQAAEQGQEPDEEGARKAVETWKGTPRGLATALDEPPHMVKQALEKLMEETAVVRRTDNGKYYRRG